MPAKLPLALPQPTGVQLLLQPNGIRTVKGQCAGVIRLSFAESGELCVLTRLMLYLQHRQAANMPVQFRLFNPLTCTQGRFAVTALSSSCIGKHLHKHLVDSGLYQGESNHGFRRGRMQDYASKGMEHADIGALAQIKTPAVTAQYLDVSRQAMRLDRLKRPFPSSV